MNNIISRAFAGTTVDKHAHTKITRNTDTIKNTYVRKLTSIALMAIMVGGGLTFAIPGMEPAYAAQINSNPNLKVSAEGQNADNEIGATNIVQVVVLDDLISDVPSAPPIVTVDGNDLNMYQTGSGAWYAYFADEDIKGTGLPVPVACADTATCDGAIAATDATDAVTAASLVRAAPGATTPTNDQRTLYFFDLSDSFNIVYDSPAGSQTVSMEYDDPDSSVGLDRANYPQNTGVVVTLNDQALNVDPTDGDTWYFTTEGDPLYGTVANAENIGDICSR